MLCKKAKVLIFNSDHLVAFSLILHADRGGVSLFMSVFAVHGHDMPLRKAEECRIHTSLWS